MHKSQDGVAAFLLFLAAIASHSNVAVQIGETKHWHLYLLNPMVRTKKSVAKTSMFKTLTHLRAYGAHSP